VNAWKSASSCMYFSDLHCQNQKRTWASVVCSAATVACSCALSSARAASSFEAVALCSCSCPTAAACAACNRAIWRTSESDVPSCRRKQPHSLWHQSALILLTKTLAAQGQTLLLGPVLNRITCECNGEPSASDVTAAADCAASSACCDAAASAASGACSASACF
jgi:hypothetical protein